MCGDVPRRRMAFITAATLECSATLKVPYENSWLSQRCKECLFFPQTHGCEFLNLDFSPCSLLPAFSLSLLTPPLPPPLAPHLTCSSLVRLGTRPPGAPLRWPLRPLRPSGHSHSRRAPRSPPPPAKCQTRRWMDGCTLCSVKLPQSTVIPPQSFAHIIIKS